MQRKVDSPEAFDVAKHIIVMEFDEAPSPVDPEVRAYVYSLVSAVSKFPT